MCGVIGNMPLCHSGVRSSSLPRSAVYKSRNREGILEFDSDTTIGEINSEDNLIWLCPNHHKMLEMGLIKLDAKKEQ